MKLEAKPACLTEKHERSQKFDLTVATEALDKAARMFRALGDTSRLRLVSLLAQGPFCVTELADIEKESITVISQRLRILRAHNVVSRRRDGKHMVYFLADQHVLDLVFNGLAHASERPFPIHTQPLSPRLWTQIKGVSPSMSDHKIHADHPHQHGQDCGHTAIQHDDHVDYLHDGHLHSLHDGHVDEHTLEVTAQNPADCTNGHDCNGHAADHKHGSDCGHEAVPHGDHVDYLVDGHLHHPDGDHCDNHGNVTVVS